MPVDLIPPPPESESALATLRWVIAALISMLVALAGAFPWLLNKFLKREENTIGPLAGSVDSLADSVGDLTDEVGTVSEHQSEANRLAHERLILAADRQQGGRG